jgi:alpha-1,2-mannosyltransferase
MDYDLTVAGVAIAFLTRLGLRDGFAPWHVTMLALLWCMPILARPVAGAIGFPLGLTTLVAGLALVVAAAIPRARLATAAG